MEGKNSGMGASKNPGESSYDEHPEATAADLEEFESVSAEIDNLNSVLDNMESNVDNIKEELVRILMSNREILKELKEENENSDTTKEKPESDDKSMETS